MHLKLRCLTGFVSLMSYVFQSFTWISLLVLVPNFSKTENSIIVPAPTRSRFELFFYVPFEVNDFTFRQKTYFNSTCMEFVKNMFSQNFRESPPL